MGLFSHKKVLDKDRLPHCVAFIIDGNGRWAKKRGMPRMFGHRAGIEAVKNTISNAEVLGLKEVMFFCFSTENWNRPKAEVDGLFNLFREFVFNDAKYYLSRNIKFKLCGDKTRIPNDIVQQVEKIEKETENCNKMQVCLCINYGGRYDIVNAVNSIIKSKKQSITEKEFSKYLLTNGISDPDLIVRTSGEIRISNFLLFQMAYSELYFTKTYWPDFAKKDLYDALIEFQGRNRRFGAIKE